MTSPNELEAAVKLLADMARFPGTISFHGVSTRDLNQAITQVLDALASITRERDEAREEIKRLRDECCKLANTALTQAQRATKAEAGRDAMREVNRKAGHALDVADRIIERGYGLDTPEEWNVAYRSVAEASRAALVNGEGGE